MRVALLWATKGRKLAVINITTDASVFRAGPDGAKVRLDLKQNTGFSFCTAFRVVRSIDPSVAYPALLWVHSTTQQSCPATCIPKERDGRKAGTKFVQGSRGISEVCK